MAIRIYMTDDTIFARLPVAYETYYIVDENVSITAQLAVPVNGGESYRAMPPYPQPRDYLRKVGSTMTLPSFVHPEVPELNPNV